VREDEVNRLLRSMAAAVSSGQQQAVNLSEMVSAYVADASVHAIIASNLRDTDRRTHVPAPAGASPLDTPAASREATYDRLGA
jgi:hypothetical protein